MPGINPRLVMDEVFQNLTDADIDEITRYIDAVALIKIGGGTGEFCITLEGGQIRQEVIRCKDEKGRDIEHIDDYQAVCYLLSEDGSMQKMLVS